MPKSVLDDTLEFIARRLEQLLIEEGHPVDRIRAVLPRAGEPQQADRILAQLDSLINDERLRGLAEALQRCRRIVPTDTAAGYDAAALREPAEIRPHEVVKQVQADWDGRPGLTRFVEIAGGIVGPVSTFFDEVLVMTDDRELAQARLGLLATIRDLGVGVLDWDQLRVTR